MLFSKMKMKLVIFSMKRHDFSANNVTVQEGKP